MKKRIKNILLIFIALFAMSCSEDNNNIPEQPTTSASPDIYVVGKTKHTPTLWKNRIASELTDGTYTAEALSVTVANNDVYVAGFEKINLTKKATLWKNGNATDLSNNAFTSYARSVTVVNNDVYVAGFEYETSGSTFVAKVWKNGVSSNLTNGNHVP